ncbi:MAG: ribosome small subunit-dependent GTPase A [Flavobacteriales bacterium]
MRGKVIKSTGSWFIVRVENNAILQCKIKGKFRMQGIKTTNPIAVGDEVEVEQTQKTDDPVITKIYPRQNYIIRKSVNLSKEAHILASNIDQAMLFVTLAFPETSLSFIDRFLITAEAYKIPCVLIFNKIDLYDEETLEDLEAYQMMYEALSVPCLSTSASCGDGLEEVKARLKDKTTMISGHSGVGKSTLINALDPALDIKTDEISEIHLQGKHTTTFAELHELYFGASIIDTPGVRGFGLVYFEKEELRHLFPEFSSYAEACKFSNCMHINEPKCAVKQAVETGELFETRYENYLQFVEDVEENQKSSYR